MVGDFNTFSNTSMDRKGNHTTNYHLQALKEIMNVMDILEFVDIGRLKYPDCHTLTVDCFVCFYFLFVQGVMWVGFLWLFV